MRDTCSNKIEIKSCPPPKKVKIEQDEKKRLFVLVSDKHTKPLPDPLPDNYSPEITVALNKLVPLPTLEKFITAVGRAVFALKCYPTSKELQQVAIQAVEKWIFLWAPHGTPYVSIPTPALLFQGGSALTLVVE